MVAARTEMYRLQELVRLHRLGVRPRERCRLLTMSPKTEMKYRLALQSAGFFESEAGEELPEEAVLRDAVERSWPQPAARAVESSADRWSEPLRTAFDAGTSPRGIWDRLKRSEDEFDVSYDAVKRLFRRWKREAGPRAGDVAIPVETEPGHIAQVDFGYLGELMCERSGRLRKAWVFVLTLGYSRWMFASVVFDQCSSTWQRLHREAFEKLGGVPRTVVPDNLKAAVIRASFGASDRHAIELNRGYVELARHYGFLIDPTPARAPQKKGKVESDVAYIKRNWWPSLPKGTIEEANRDLAHWLEHTANARCHGSTLRRPDEMLADVESQRLGALPASRWTPVCWKQATVHRDAHIEFDGRLYSVPWQHIGERVWVRATDKSVEVRRNEQRLTVHEREGKGRRSTNELHLPEGRRDLMHRCESYWVDRADALSPAVGAFVREVLQSDDVLSKLRDVQAIVTHLETFPRSRADAAVRRASAYGNLSYQGIRRILRDALDLLPLPDEQTTRYGRLTSPRFARSGTDYHTTTREVPHEPVG
jgi:transposase